MKTNEINMAEEMGNVVAIRHLGIRSLKVQISPDNARDSKSRWSAFASSEGVAIPFFAGKSFASRKTAERAAIRYLEERAANYVQATKVTQFVASSANDVLQHSTPPTDFSW